MLDYSTVKPDVMRKFNAADNRLDNAHYEVERLEAALKVARREVSNAQRSYNYWLDKARKQATPVE